MKITLYHEIPVSASERLKFTASLRAFEINYWCSVSNEFSSE
jgi:hypothetical protein